MGSGRPASAWSWRGRYPYFDSVAYAYEAGAGLAVAEGDVEAAGHLLGAADMARRTMSAALWPLLQPQRDAVAARIEEHVGPERLGALRDEGAALGPPAAVARLERVTGT